MNSSHLDGRIGLVVALCVLAVVILIRAIFGTGQQRSVYHA